MYNWSSREKPIRVVTHDGRENRHFVM